MSACAWLQSSRPERPEAQTQAVYLLQAAPIGSVDGVTIFDGGYSALTLTPDGQLWATTDRGPNLEAFAAAGAAAKRFPLPDYAPAAVALRIIDQKLVAQRRLTYHFGNRNATGLPPPERNPSIVTEQALGPDFEPLTPDPDGIDSEGITFLNGHLWISEEYRPSLWQLDSATGEVLARYTPTPSGPLDRPLPTWPLERSPNLGFEGLTAVGPHLYAALQGPLRPARGDAATPLTRILRLDPATGESLAFAYALEGPLRKIGDLATLPDGRVLVLEHGAARLGAWSAEIYVVDFRNATPVETGSPLPEYFRSELAARQGGVPVLEKSIYIDLLRAGWSTRWEKPEGLTVDTAGTVWLVNDNDYGLDSPQATGAALPTNAETVLVKIR